MCKAIVVANETNSAKKAFHGRLEAIGIDVVAWVRLDMFLNGYAPPDAELIVFNDIGVEKYRHRAIIAPAVSWGDK